MNFKKKRNPLCAFLASVVLSLSLSSCMLDDQVKQDEKDYKNRQLQSAILMILGSTPSYVKYNGPFSFSESQVGAYGICQDTSFKKAHYFTFNGKYSQANDQMEPPVSSRPLKAGGLVEIYVDPCDTSLLSDELAKVRSLAHNSMGPCAQYPDYCHIAVCYKKDYNSCATTYIQKIKNTVDELKKNGTLPLNINENVLQ